MPEVQYWREWRRHCALGLCGDGVRNELTGFVATRFQYYVRKCAHLTNADSPVQLIPQAADAWHLFETAVRIRNTRTGKSYKQWLFARCRAGEGDSVALDGGVSLLVRDVVRDYLRREHSPRIMASIDRPLCNKEGSTLSLHELLPDPAGGDAVEQREIKRLAESCARDIIRRLAKNERVALAARAYGVPLSDLKVLAAADCGKSALAEAYSRGLRHIADYVNERFANEDRATRAELAIATLAKIDENVPQAFLPVGMSAQP